MTLLNDAVSKNILINTEKNSYSIKGLKDVENISEKILSISLTFQSIEERQQYDFDNIKNLSVYSNGVFTDILKKKTSKATSILKIYDKVNGTELYTIGDGENDISMLEVGNKSYTFKSSLNSVKNSANFICDNIDKILQIINDE